MYIFFYLIRFLRDRELLKRDRCATMTTTEFNKLSLVDGIRGDGLPGQMSRRYRSLSM